MSEAYDDFARRILASGIVTDPWIDGAPRFREAPIVLSAAEQRALYRAAEAGRFDVVAQLARELEARRLSGADNVVALDAKAGKRRA